MNPTICPHCSASNVTGSAFCETCGKALPSSAASAPRIVNDTAFAATGVGQKLQSDELRKQLNRASGALLAVAIIQTIFGAIFFAAFQNAPRAAAGNNNLLFITIFGIGAMFWGLWGWSRFNPLPAAIVGLVIYVTLWVLDLVMYFVTASKVRAGSPNVGASPLNGIILRIIVIAILAKAIGAGVKYRQLQRQQQLSA